MVRSLSSFLISNKSSMLGHYTIARILACYGQVLDGYLCAMFDASVSKVVFAQARESGPENVACLPRLFRGVLLFC